MKYRLSKHAIDVMTARGINRDWVEYTVDNPSLKVVKAPNEVQLFSTIDTHEKRCLKG